MRDMTEKNLSDAFAGESQAHMKYLAFADRADRENLPNVARLFRAVAHAERVHATNHLRTLGQIHSSTENLAAAKAGEDFEITEMYPAYLSVAELQDERPARTAMNYALQAEKEHSKLYGRVHETLTDDPGKDIALNNLWVCPVCGYTVEGNEAPERCPVCNTKRERFEQF